ncbi:hypothetical protein BpHYR1_000704 [Brachionus plicatilis]|uniref:Uncharacterized protein n=1 Tax=Brachionus plicatilis TaxID=10195 RepID=A0A3M7T600_BRAPC|nr:hypothetical protein BpHYR1_000704 [Brachionus plicatilis]
MCNLLFNFYSEGVLAPYGPDIDINLEHGRHNNYLERQKIHVVVIMTVPGSYSGGLVHTMRQNSSFISKLRSNKN